MKSHLVTLAAALALSALASHAFAAGCESGAADKKLAGAAKTSFMKKCMSDAKAACDKSAADKKLAGAAKTSFVTKCEKDGA